MSSAVTSAPSEASRPSVSFVTPVLDYLVIGGGLSLLWCAVLVAQPDLAPSVNGDTAMLAVLFANVSHFAASTVRLYTIPGARESWPRLTTLFPLLVLGVLVLCLTRVETLGTQLRSLYFTWSPYHYAAQAYGLALMYSYRAGSRPDATDKRLLRWACLLPFFLAFVEGVGAGLDWLLPVELQTRAWVRAGREGASDLLVPLIYLAPLGLYVRMWRGGRRMPAISLLVVLTNGVWWTLFSYMSAFVWATVAHGLQYLAIAMIFHVKDQTKRPGNRHGPVWHAGWFYAVSLLLGYALFFVLPFFFVLLGFGYVESFILVVAMINLHHFIVDGFIWRLSKGTSRQQVW